MLDHAMQLTHQEAGAVESVVHALHKVIALLDRIKNAIEESSNKIPKASVHLNNVTQATEIATVEILNVLDSMSQKIEKAGCDVSAVGGQVSSDKGRELIASIRNKLAEANADAMNITMALQVQDITAQKIAAANDLIESVREELMRELSYFETSGAPTTLSVERPIARSPIQAFDKNASYVKPMSLQERVDQVVQQWREKQGV